jgi:hypothetical protein
MYKNRFGQSVLKTVVSRYFIGHVKIFEEKNGQQNSFQ